MKNAPDCIHRKEIERDSLKGCSFDTISNQSDQKTTDTGFVFLGHCDERVRRWTIW